MECPGPSGRPCLSQYTVNTKVLFSLPHICACMCIHPNTYTSTIHPYLWWFLIFKHILQWRSQIVKGKSRIKSSYLSSPFTFSYPGESGTIIVTVNESCYKRWGRNYCPCATSFPSEAKWQMRLRKGNIFALLLRTEELRFWINMPKAVILHREFRISPLKLSIKSTLLRTFEDIYFVRINF